MATAIADHLGIFSDVLASNGKKNLKGAVKCKALRERYGDRGFDYAGDAAGDVKVWAHSNASIVVNALKSVVRKAEAIGRVSRVFARKGNTLSTLVRVLRIKLEPGAKTKMHAHPANCVVELTTGTTKDGAGKPTESKAGEASCGDALSHAPENVGKTLAETIVFEFKNRQAFKS